MSGLDVELRDLTVDYKDTRAVDSVTASFPANTITGLLGRNGSGKTTMLSVIASLRRPSAGLVLVDGRDPYEDEQLMEQVCLIRESGDVLAEEKLKVTLKYIASARPNWDQEFAEELLDAFEVDIAKKPTKVSRGQRSAFGAVIGLASRAPVTMFDEVYLGMDAPSRRRFYDLLIADYVEHPRTIILSSHLISEVEQLFEGVVVLDGGRVEDEPAVLVRAGPPLASWQPCGKIRTNAAPCWTVAGSLSPRFLPPVKANVAARTVPFLQRHR